MNPLSATLVYATGIAAMFYFDRDKQIHTSKALWIPIIWLMINGSRPVSLWLKAGTPIAPTDVNVDGSPLDAAIFGLLVVAGLVVLGMRWKSLVGFVRDNPILVTFLAYCLLSTLWSDYSFIAFKRWTKSLGDVVMIAVVLTDPDMFGAIGRFFCRVGYVLIPASILLIKYYPDIGRVYDTWTWVPFNCGVTTFKNLLGMITLVCALGTLWCFLRSWRERRSARRRHLIVQGAMLLMSVYIFVIADSMTSLSCFVLAGCLMFFANQSWVSRRPALIHVTVAAIVTLSLVALFFDSSGDLVKTLGRNSTLTGRTDIWRIVLELSQPRPWFGTGFESFWMGDRLQTMYRFEKGIQEAHNGYLEIYANLGWVGVGLLAALIVTGYRHAMATYRRDRALGSIKLAFFITGIVYSFTEAGFRLMSPVWLAFLLGIIYVPLRGLKRQTAPVVARAAPLESQLHSRLVTTYKGGF